MLSKFNKLIYTIELLPKLGFWNVLYMVWYRLSMRTGIRKRFFPQSKLPQGEFYRERKQSAVNYHESWRNACISKADEIIDDTFTYFSYHKYQVKDNKWISNPFDGSIIPDNTIHWTEMSDFDLPIGDVKIVWELSRFDWLTDLARAYSISQNKKYLSKINSLLNNWCETNPLNTGVNWKCGQEAGFRVFKLISTAMILDQLHEPSQKLKELIYAHISRIQPNINYAIAQDNNHGTTEAAALYIGCQWLLHVGSSYDNLHAWAKQGEQLLLGRIDKLIETDGSFAQRSMTYHRVVLDTFTWVLSIKSKIGLNSWDSGYMNKLNKLAEWQYKFTFGRDGDAPNYGSNDGANIGNLNNLDYRDFRGSSQAYWVVANDMRLYMDSGVDEAAYWYTRKKIQSLDKYEILIPEVEVLDDHNVIMRKGEHSLYLKLPDDKFRPGTDAFHLDLWTNGICVLRDNGSYSYNAGQLTDMMKSSRYHNTLSFNNHEQMPKLSRFLNAKWLRTNSSDLITKEGKIKWSGSYTDYKKCTHQRKITFTESELLIKDIGQGSNFTINYHMIEDNLCAEISSSHDYEIMESEYSRYYMEKTKKPSISFIGKSEEVVEVKIKLN